MNEEFAERQALIVKQLFERIFYTFDGFSSTNPDDNSLEEVKFVLKKMQSLTLERKILLKLEEYLNKKYFSQLNVKCLVLELGKGHLFYFQPSLGKCIRSNDFELRNIAAEIIEELGMLLLTLEQ